MFRTIQNHPIALLVVGAVAFGAWLWRDAMPATAAAHTESPDIRPVPPHGYTHPHRMLHGDPHAILAHLPPRAPRAIVEVKLGVHPIDHNAAPVVIEESSATYTVTYPLPGGPLVLEFDATLPGHPLVAAHAEPQS